MLNLEKYKVLLASNSPRRRELLTQLCIEFEIAPAIEIDECFPTQNYVLLLCGLFYARALPSTSHKELSSLTSMCLVGVTQTVVFLIKKSSVVVRTAAGRTRPLTRIVGVAQTVACFLKKHCRDRRPRRSILVTFYAFITQMTAKP